MVSPMFFCVAVRGILAVGLRSYAHMQSSSSPKVQTPPTLQRQLDALYDGLDDVHDIPAEEIRIIDESGGHDAYGELTTSGVRDVLQRLGGRSGDVVADLGSGCGRMVLQCALEWPFLSSVIGVELSKTRHDTATKALHRCEAMFGPDVSRRVQLVHGDMLAPDVAGLLDHVTLVYVASLLFDDEFMIRLGGMLSARPKLRRVATLSRFPAGALPGFHEQGVFMHVQETMSR